MKPVCLPDRIEVYVFRCESCGEFWTLEDEKPECPDCRFASRRHELIGTFEYVPARHHDTSD